MKMISKRAWKLLPLAPPHLKNLGSAEMLFHPIVGILKNTATGRYHPLLMEESPLPGPPAPDKPVRFKSRMHHTGGFDTRAEAEVGARELANHEQVQGRFAIADDLEWDGEGVPVTVAFLSELSEGQLKLVTF